jgi:hypothetical protein
MEGEEGMNEEIKEGKKTRKGTKEEKKGERNN